MYAKGRRIVHGIHGKARKEEGNGRFEVDLPQPIKRNLTAVERCSLLLL
jgi:hypothetical protein